jgi:hypothetical protein
MPLIQFCRTLSPQGIITLSRNPPKGSYSPNPVSMQPDGKTEDGAFYCYDKGLSHEVHELNFPNNPEADAANLRAFLADVTHHKARPCLFRDPDGKVWTARFADTDKISYPPIATGRKAIQNVVLEVADTACHLSGSATLANTVIIPADGYAALDFNAANILTDHAGMMIDVYDSGLNRASGFIKAAGSGSGFTDPLPTMTSNTTPSGVASANSYLDGFDAWQAMDKDLSEGNGWSTNDNDVTGWLGYEWATPKTIKRYSIYSFAYAAAQAPKDWAIEGSNDGTSWTVLDTRANETAWVFGTPKTYNVTAPGAYTHYRINISANNGGPTYIMVSELKLEEYAPTSTGVTIVNTPGGTTYNWRYKDPAFNPSDPAGYTYKIYTEGV